MVKVWFYVDCMICKEKRVILKYSERCGIQRHSAPVGHQCFSRSGQREINQKTGEETETLQILYVLNPKHVSLSLEIL